ALASRRWIDRAGLLQMAIERLRTDSGAIEPRVLVLIPESIDANGLERQLLHAVPQDRRIELHVDRVGHSSGDKSPGISDRALLALVRSPGEAPAPKGDGSASIFTAVGEINEVREVIRRCLAKKIKLDEVEVLCTDVNTYVPLIFETFARLAPND